MSAVFTVLGVDPLGPVSTNPRLDMWEAAGTDGPIAVERWRRPLAAWTAVLMLTGVLAATVRSGDSAGASTRSTAVTTTTSGSAATTETDLRQLLVDISSFGYSEVSTPVSGALPKDKFVSLVPAAQQAEFRGGLDSTGYVGGYARLSLSEDARVVMEQMVLQFDRDLDANSWFARGFAAGVAGQGGTGERFSVPGIPDSLGLLMRVPVAHEGARAGAIITAFKGGRIYVALAIAYDAKGAVDASDVIPIAQAQAAFA